MKKKVIIILILILLCSIAYGQKKKVLLPVSSNTHIDSVAKKVFINGWYYVSAELYKQIINSSKSSKTKKAYAYEMLGNISTRVGEYNEAIRHFLSAGRIYYSLQDTLSTAWIYNHIGYTYAQCQMFDKAMEFYQKSEQTANLIVEKKKTDYLYGILYMNMSGIWLAKEQNNLFFVNVFASLEFLKDSKDLSNFIINYNNIALAYQRIGRLDKAELWFQKALKLCIEIGDKKLLSMIYSNVGLLLSENREYVCAENYLLKALDLSEEIASISSQKQRHLDLAILYSEKGDFKRALEHKDQAYNLIYSMFSEESAKQTAEMLAKYKLELTEKELQINVLSLREQEQKSKMLRFFLIICLVIILIISALIKLIHGAKKKISCINNVLEMTNKNLNKEKQRIFQSLESARNIQKSMLPSDENLRQKLKDHFVFYSPKDIVSGDFYWIKKDKSEILFALADCTGHGIPAALLTMFGYEILNQFVQEKKFVPTEVVNYLNEQIILSFHAEKNCNNNHGMDIIVGKINTETLYMEYANVKMKAYVIHEGETIKLSSDNFPLGIDMSYVYNKYTMQLSQEDIVYLLSDGYSDQFGGSKNKKFSQKKLKSLIGFYHSLPLEEQKKILVKNFLDWKSTTEQTDDVLVMGIRV